MNDEFSLDMIKKNFMILLLIVHHRIQSMIAHYHGSGFHKCTYPPTIKIHK